MGRQDNSNVNDFIMFSSGAASYAPLDIKRKLLSFEGIATKLKMRQTRNMLIYLCGGVTGLFKGELRDGDFLHQQTWRLISGIRSVSSFTCRPLPDASLKKGKKLFREYFCSMVDHYGPTFASWKLHNVSIASYIGAIV